MTTVIFLGSHHHDPEGKTRLHHAFNRLSAKYKNAPHFVAFEWAYATYAALVSRRREVEMRLKAEFPGIGTVFLAHLADTLAFEGDLHQELMPSARPIWMLDGYPRYDIQVSGNVEGFTSSKSTQIREEFMKKISNFEQLGDEELLNATTKVCLEESRGQSQVTELPQALKNSIERCRETHMFSMILKALTQTNESDPIVITIIGTAHLLDLPNTLFNQCVSAGFHTEKVWHHEQ